MAEQPPPETQEDAGEETADVLSRLFLAWKPDHLEGTWRTFWDAVRAGEVKMTAL